MHIDIKEKVELMMMKELLTKVTGDDILAVDFVNTCVKRDMQPKQIIKNVMNMYVKYGLGA